MLQTRSDATRVWIVNTAAAGGASVVVTNTPLPVIIQNSGGLYAMQSGAWNISSTILNSAGWIVNVANTNNNVNIINSAGWVVNVANTGGSFILRNSAIYAMQSGAWAVSSTILNSAGWVVSQSNTAGMTVSIINSAGWVFNQANTGGQVIIRNSGGLFAQQSGTWVVTVANTGGTTLSQTLANTAGWVIAQSNTNGLREFSTIETGQMSSMGVALTAGYAVINANGTNNTIVSAVAGRKIRVIAYNLMSELGNNVRFQSGTGASNLLTGFHFIGTNGGLVAGYNPVGWFETSGGNLLNLKCATAQSVGGGITYLEI